MDAEQLAENAWLDYMDAREAALDAAAGRFVVNNVPTSHLREMVNQGNSRDVVTFAAQIVLHSRGEQWRPTCGSANSDRGQGEDQITPDSQAPDLPAPPGRSTSAHE